MNRYTGMLATLAILGMSYGSGLAAVNAEEAKQLGGTTLTAFGAEKAGNKEGTIPPYTGQFIGTPSSYDPKEPGRRPDPFNEKPLFSITAQNAAQYAAKLDAIVDIFKIYPSFRMDVYPAHRNFVYPKTFLDNSIANATSCKAVDGELRLEGCYGGMPFPIPKTGAQVMWNHLLQYNASPALKGNLEAYVTAANGAAVVQSNIFSHTEHPAFSKGAERLASDTLYLRGRVDVYGPTRRAGEKFVLQDSMDMAGVGQRAWLYLPGQRRVKLMPDLAYDTPGITSGGTSTMDDAVLFSGALDRYDWKLIGKREKFIPYNTFAQNDYQVCPNQKIVNHRNFPDPDCVRWELHRVWVVGANLKPAFRHIYKRRLFYFDEDVPGAGVSEAYDASDKLYRIQFGSAVPFYDAPGGLSNSYMTLDLQTGLWGAVVMGSFKGGGQWPGPAREDAYFSPDALAGAGIR